MSETTPPANSAAVLVAAEPQLFVADVLASCEFYVSKLGFTVVFAYGEPPFYGQVKRDSACLNLRGITESVFAGDIRERESGGVEFYHTLRHEPWGTRTFVVRDPDGNLVLFVAPNQ